MRFAVSSVRGWRVLAGVCAPLACAACSSIRPSYDSPEPAARNAAIVETARTMNAGDVPRLVDMLSSDDPATRVLAIRTLERLTGQTLGYQPESDRWEREEAIARWRATLDDGGPATLSGAPRRGEREGAARASDGRVSR